jgi:hypothetical protein
MDLEGRSDRKLDLQLRRFSGKIGRSLQIWSNGGNLHESGLEIF